MASHLRPGRQTGAMTTDTLPGLRVRVPHGLTSNNALAVRYYSDGA